MNTFKITLQDAVTDPSIRRIDELRFEVPATASSDSKKVIELAMAANGKIRCPDGSMFDANPSAAPVAEKVLYGNNNFVYFWFSSPGSHLMISPKSKVYGFRSSTIIGNLSAFKFTDTLRILNASSFAGSVGDINQDAIDAMSEFIIHGESVIGNISVFSENETLQTFNVSDTSIEGDILSLSNCIALHILRFHDSHITGDVDDLADAMFANGRTSGTMIYTYNSSGSGTTYTFSDEGWSKT